MNHYKLPQKRIKSSVHTLSLIKRVLSLIKRSFRLSFNCIYCDLLCIQ